MRKKGNFLCAGDFSKGARNQSGALADMDGNAASQVGQSEIHHPIPAVCRSKKGVKSLMVRYGNQASVAEGVVNNRVIKPNY